MENVIFKVHIPNSEGGTANTMKGFISGLSINKNTKIQCNPRNPLGCFDTVLEDEHLLRENETMVIEPFSSCRWLVLKEEEAIQKDLPNEFSQYGVVDLNNKTYEKLFSDKVMIDWYFDRSLIHDTIYNRIASAIKNIKFKSIISEESDKYNFDYENSLSISVRTWKSVCDPVPCNRGYSFDVYKNKIDQVLKEHPNITTVFLSLDRPDVKDVYINYLKSLNLNVILYEKPNNINLLQYAIINVFILAKCKYYICNRISTFAELVYWFGECKQQVYTVY